jgi:DNA-binding NarL/FixJ family response regulator
MRVTDSLVNYEVASLLKSFPTMRSTAGTKKVFLVDDQPIVIEGLQDLISDQTDLCCVGVRTLITSDLADAVRDSSADVVLIDAEFGSWFRRSYEASGITAIRNIRRKLGSQIGIVAYTSHERYAETCIDAGADRFLVKGEAGHNESDIECLLNAIRNCKDHGVLTSLEIGKGSEVLLHARQHGMEVRAQLQVQNPSALSLLTYLAHERASGQENWLSRIEKRDIYVFRNIALWSEIATIHSVAKAECWKGDYIATVARCIDQGVRQAIRLENDVRLISMPALLRNVGWASCAGGICSLNEFIECSRVVLRNA